MTDASRVQPLSATDQVHQSLVMRLAPPSWRPFMLLARLDRPIGTWLLLLPCFWSLSLAVGPETTAPEFIKYALLFAVGATLMRGAGCVLNDIADRDFDGQVARTALRPIPSGQVTVQQAIGFMVVLSLLGLIVLMQFNSYTVVLGICSLGVVAIYPFMKRITHWPQFVLGLAFNWGGLLGWTALKGELALPAILTYVAGIAWTLGYDTIYAHQDKEDDSLIGVKSTALKLGDKTPQWLVGFYLVAWGGLVAAGILVGLGALFYVFMILAGLHLAMQVLRLDMENPKVCLTLFKSNKHFGMLVVLAFLLGHLAV